jgi:hypothetical protein
VSLNSYRLLQPIVSGAGTADPPCASPILLDNNHSSRPETVQYLLMCAVRVHYRYSNFSPRRHRFVQIFRDHFCGAQNFLARCSTSKIIYKQFYFNNIWNKMIHMLTYTLYVTITCRAVLRGRISHWPAPYATTTHRLWP